ncbi:MAG: substrate-binding domain-containing protein [Yoonia sp.]|nr:substrate-binding domain-containing protein [Yoonia sp.]
MIRSITAVFAVFIGTMLAAEDMRLAVTTSFDNSGLADILIPEIKADTGLNVQLLVVGTGQALRLGAAGDVDAVLVHSRSAEDAFLANGHGTHRREIMYNDFVLIGPSGLGVVATITEAMSALATIKAPFISRGDDSGTHKAELRLWEAANLNTTEFGNWYRAVGAGMGAALNAASAMDAYVISDRASWLNFGNKGNLTIAFSGDPALFNQYAYLPVNPDKGENVRYSSALRLEDWLTSDRAKALINGYRIDGQPLFVFNATP